MDLDEAIRLLKGGPEGVAEWNRRRAASEEIPGLHRAGIREFDLSEANLRETNLGGANLVRDLARFRWGKVVKVQHYALILRDLQKEGD